METSVIPFAFFRVVEGNVKTVLVSDGLCVLLGKNREATALCIEGEIYDFVHPEDVEALRKTCREFFFGSGEMNTSFTIKLKISAAKQ